MNYQQRLQYAARRQRFPRPSCRPDPGRRVPPIPGPSSASGRQLLHGSWPGVMCDLRHMGRVITTTEHPGAVLSVAGSYPELDVAAHGLWATNWNRRLSLDFTAWQEVHWLQEQISDNTLRSIEVLNLSGQRVHTVVLLAGDPAEEFAQLLQDYSQPDLPAIFRAAAPRASAPWQSKLDNRRELLPQTPDVGCSPMPSASLPELFRLLKEEQPTMLMGVYTGSAIQRHAWKVADTCMNQGWLNAWNHDAALHLSLDSLGELWHTHGQCACCGEDRWTLEAYDPSHKLMFTMQAADPKEEVIWRELVSQ